MAEIIRMPRLSDTMEEGVIVEWLAKVGDTVKHGDVLAEVETDKATMELESFQDGVLLHIGVESGAVPVDGIIAVIGKEGEDFAEQLEEAQSKGSAGPSSDASNDESKEEPVSDQGSSNNSSSATSSPAQASDSRVKASPLAKSMAKEAGISLSGISGSGDGGRIVKKDVEDAISSGATSVAPSVSLPTSGSENVTVSQMRKTIARRLAESKFSAPHFYLTIEIDMANAAAARQRLKAADIKVSFNDLVVKACANALKKHPAVNSSWHGEHITVHHDVHIGVAVAVEDGLMVPVVKHANHKSLTTIGGEVRELAGKARDKKLSLDEMQGNTFTISNLGMFGIEEFTAIINPPDACILAVGGIMDKPVVRNGQIVPGKIMKVTLSCDHRVVDGATGAQFLNTLKQNLEEPLMMIA